jgi:hypothetical protein
MSYQPQFAVTATPPPTKPISKWWWIGLLISWIIFLVIGGGLIGAGSGDNSCVGDIYCSGSDSLYYGAYACFAIGGILHLAYWAVLIVWLTQRRRSRLAVVYVDSFTAQAGTAGKTFPQQPPTATYMPQTYLSPQEQFNPQPSPTPTPTYQAQSRDCRTTTPARVQAMGSFCGNCGAATSTRFCTQCGAQA